MKCPSLAIVVPCYNEEAVLPETNKRLSGIIGRLCTDGEISGDSFVLFVDDGSSDKTWKCITEKAASSATVKGLKLSRRFGHQNALLAGLGHVRDKVDIAITIDADLQQDENAIPRFVMEYKKGNEIVYGVRKDREADKLFKKTTAVLFYKFMRLMGVQVIPNHADYRLLSRRVLTELANCPEANVFLRGLIPTLGFRATTVEYDVRERFGGKSKYSFAKMVSLAITAITSLSIVPMRMIAVIGFAVFIFSLTMSVFVVLVYLRGIAVPGWASTVLPIYFISGIQLVSLGIIGEYIGKIYVETKKRPKYVIEESV